MEEYSGNKFCFNFDEKPEAHKEQAPVFYNRYVKKVTSNMEEDYYGGVKLTEREKEDLTSQIDEPRIISEIQDSSASEGGIVASQISASKLFDEQEEEGVPEIKPDEPMEDESLDIPDDELEGILEPTEIEKPKLVTDKFQKIYFALADLASKHSKTIEDITSFYSSLNCNYASLVLFLEGKIDAKEQWTEMDDSVLKGSTTSAYYKTLLEDKSGESIDHRKSFLGLV